MPIYRKIEFLLCEVEKDKSEPVADAEWEIKPLELGRSMGWSGCPHG